MKTPEELWLLAKANGHHAEVVDGKLMLPQTNGQFCPFCGATRGEIYSRKYAAASVRVYHMCKCCNIRLRERYERQGDKRVWRDTMVHGEA